MKIAIAQFTMAPDLAGSIELVLQEIEHCAKLEVDLLITPELSLTGFHRGIISMPGSQELQDGLERTKAQCAKFGVNAVVSLPLLQKDQQVRHKTLFLDAHGETLLNQDKCHLTPSEAKFFQPGEQRHWCEFKSASFAVMSCCEILEASDLLLTSQNTDLILWPSYIKWDADLIDLSEDYQGAARQAALDLDTWVIQANWASSVNDPTTREMGGSQIYAPGGELVFEAPRDAFFRHVFEVAI